MKQTRQTKANFKLKSGERFAALGYYINGREIKNCNTVSFLNEVDATEIDRIRTAYKLAKLPVPSYTTFVVKALALALSEFPGMNRRIHKLPLLPAKVQAFAHVDIAVASERDTEDEPSAAFFDICRDADGMPLGDLNDWLGQLGNRNVANPQWNDYHMVATRLPAWLASVLVSLPIFSPLLWTRWRGAAAIVSSPAKYGIDTVLGCWPHPIGVSFGLARKKAVVVDEKIVARNCFTLTLTFDRNIAAGGPAARFMARFSKLLQDPLSLLKLEIPAEVLCQLESDDSRGVRFKFSSAPSAQQGYEKSQPSQVSLARTSIGK